MGERLSPEIRRLLEERKLTRFHASEEMVVKEVDGAKYDVDRAKKSLLERDYKWATIQAYYSMFHLARALLLRLGYRERSHRALLEALRELYVKTGRLDLESFEDLRNAMDLREEADYGMVFSEASAKLVVEQAEQFLSTVKRILQA